MNLKLPPAAAAVAGIKAMTVRDIRKKERRRQGGTDRESRCSRIHIKGVQIVRASESTKAAAFCKTARACELQPHVMLRHQDFTVNRVKK